MFMCQGTLVTLFIVIKSCYCSLRTYSDVWGPTNQSFCCKKYMLLLLMTIVYSHGSICFIANLKCFNISLNFNLLLSAYLITKSSQSSLTGWGGGEGEYERLNSFFTKLAYPTKSLALTPINRMGPLSASITILLRCVFPCLPQPLCL
jgi:hypothetical protein